MTNERRQMSERILRLAQEAEVFVPGSVQVFDDGSFTAILSPGELVPIGGHGTETSSEPCPGGTSDLTAAHRGV